MGQRCRSNGRAAVLSPLTFCLTSLGRLILMCRGFSDIRNSKVVSASGTTLLTSGPNWIFLMVRRTELLRENTKKSLLTDHIPKATEKTIALNEESLIGTVKKIVSLFVHLLVLVFTTESFHLKLHGTFLPDKDKRSTNQPFNLRKLSVFL